MARALAVIALIVAVAGAPQPPDVGSESTVAALYDGERIDFTGTYVARPLPHLVRYAITCCRADAQPVTLPLAHALRERGWVRVCGTAHRAGADVVVDPASVQAIAPPSDPFIYR